MQIFCACVTSILLVAPAGARVMNAGGVKYAISNGAPGSSPAYSTDFEHNAGSHTSAAMSETEALALLRSMADKNQVLKSLIGQGYHETHTPYVILRNMLENPVRGSASPIMFVSISRGRAWFFGRF